MRWRTVDSYMVSKIAYGSSLYWLRAEAEQIDNVRFHYSMALASIAGLETPEVVSLRSCKRQAVKANSAGFLKLCKFLNMPTLKDLAIMEARVLLRQWKSFRPHDFRLSGNLEILEVLNHRDGTLLCDLLALANSYVNDWYPTYREYCYKKKTSRVPLSIDQEDKPLWRQYWEEVVRRCPNRDQSFRDRLYTLACRDHFEVAEPYSRVKRQLDPPTLRPSQRRSPDDVLEPQPVAVSLFEPSPLEPLSKRVKLSSRRKKPTSSGSIKTGSKRRKPEEIQAPVDKLACSIGYPPVRGVKNRTCRICGYVIRETNNKRKRGLDSVIKFGCCPREAHRECWLNARTGEDADVICSEVKHWLASDKKTPRIVKLASGKPDQLTVPCRECEFCHDLVEISDKNRYHLFDHCGLEGRNDQPTLENEPQPKRRKGVAMVVGRFYELLRNQESPDDRTRLELGSNRDESPPAITSGIDRGVIAEVGVT